MTANIAIIGTGLIGRSWAIVFARAGLKVSLYDQNSDACVRAFDAVAESLKEELGNRASLEVECALSQIHRSSDLDDALAGADLVQESGPEKVDAKMALFAELDRRSDPSTLLGSSTSGITASQFTETLQGRHRCFVAHPVNPPHLVSLVELAGAPWTAVDVLERAKEIYTSVGQVPIVLRREIDGFVLNRLQAVLLAEAFRLVKEGYVSPQDVDKAVKDGLGLRWSFMGPFETIELNAPEGIADYCQRYGPTMAHLSKESPSIFAGDALNSVLAQWKSLAGPNAVAEKMHWRDGRLAALRNHKKSADDWQPQE